MTESHLQSACLKLLRRELSGAVIIKHADPFTSGVPDVSITLNGKTSWLEFKHGKTIKWANELQRLTCCRLAFAGLCRVVLYQEPARTLIVRPEGAIITDTAGFNHQFVVDYVRKVHLG